MKWLKIFIIIAVIYGTNQGTVYASSSSYKKEDTRVARLQAFLLQKKSPLAGSSAHFIKVADEYKLDWRLLPAIAGVESGFERAGNTSDFNAWGYMCKGRPCPFDSYEQAITRVAKTISTSKSYSKFQATGQIQDLAKTYTSLPEDWTLKIKYFMRKI